MKFALVLRFVQFFSFLEILRCRQTQVFKTNNGSLILRTYERTQRSIANKDILAALDVNYDTISIISDNDLNKLTVGEPVPLLSFPPTAQPDDTIALLLKRILIMQPNNYIINVYSLPGLVNPSIMRVNKKILITYGRPNFRKNKLIFGWLSNETSYEFNELNSNFNISLDTNLDLNAYNSLQDDSRLLMLHSVTAGHFMHTTPNRGGGHYHDILMTYSSGIIVNNLTLIYVPNSISISPGGKYDCHFSYVIISVPVLNEQHSAQQQSDAHAQTVAALAAIDKSSGGSGVLPVASLAAVPSTTSGTEVLR